MIQYQEYCAQKLLKGIDIETQRLSVTQYSPTDTVKQTAQVPLWKFKRMEEKWLGPNSNNIATLKWSNRLLVKEIYERRMQSVSREFENFTMKQIREGEL